MKRLTYRGIAYQKPEELTDANCELKRIQGAAKHTYRGNVYHYESKKKKVVV
jgi:hypothetical protein